jgi:tetratricopeptide (TPR) repeat protein
VLGLSLAPRFARADDLTDAKNYFKAGASAYSAGDYLAAIQALDAAYRLTPLPAIAFSLAQAERRQYFVSREPAHLLRAIELYRTYLKEVPTGGRRADATDALAQLEPLALGVATETASEPGAPLVPRATKTRIMVNSDAKGAHISLDGGEPKPAPLIAEVEAGEHAIRVTAKGYFTSDREIVAVSGELVPLEVELKEQPAVLIVEPSVEADLYVDGSYFARVRKGSRVELPSGSHELAFARQGRELVTQVVTLERGETRRLPARLAWTKPRIAAVSLFIASGATLAVGALATAASVELENQADAILARQENAALSPSELEDYEEARENRDRARAVAIGCYALSAAGLVTGAFFYVIDEPNLSEIRARPKSSPEKATPELSAAVAPTPGGLSFAARVRF